MKIYALTINIYSALLKTEKKKITVVQQIYKFEIKEKKSMKKEMHEKSRSEVIFLVLQPVDNWDEHINADMLDCLFL